MNSSKRKFRSSEAELKRKKKKNRRPNTNLNYINRKNIRRSQRLVQQRNEDKELSSYIQQRFSEDINDEKIQTLSYKRRHQKKSKIEEKRSIEEHRIKELENERSYYQFDRNNQTTFVEISVDYRKAIKEGPILKCHSCNGRFFRKSLHLVKKSKFNDWINKSDVRRILSPTKDDIYLCLTCESHLKKEMVPKLCTLNGLQLDPIPNLLKICNSVEERLFSPIIPFEQIRALGFYGKQLGIKGNVVNVPIDLPQTIECLPRKLDECHTIQIKLKRMVSHKSDYLHETIRPARVWNAINYLCQQPLFKEHNIEVNVEWMKTFGSSDEIDFVANSEDIDFFKTTSLNLDETDVLKNEFEERFENESQTSDEEFVELEDNVNPGESETVIQNNGLIMAPGEGQKPISFYSIDCEYLAFPKIYCGKSFNTGNPNKLTISELAKYKLRYYDRRFAECPQILFFLLRQKQIENLRRSINIVLKKRDPSHKELKVGDILDNQTIDKLIRSEEAYKILSQDRTSPVYWEKRMKDLMAMIRQLGIPTFFLTLSAAESQWSELIIILEKISTEKDITEEIVKNMNIEYKYQLIKDDPVTCAQYFDHKFREIFKLLKHKSGPFSPHSLLDYFVRVEFQHRGSPHVHCLFWLENVPNMNDSSNYSLIEEFIDQFISSETEVEGQLKDLIKLQQHKHTKSCRRKKNNVKSCRFGIPFYPMGHTRILTPFSGEENLDDLIDYETMHRNIREYINEIDAKIRKNDNLKALTFDGFLAQLGMNEDMYLMAIRSTLKKNTVLIKRKPSDIRLNGYNPKILELFASNMDIQFILDPYGCVHYIVNYISKSYRGVSKLMREAIEETRKGYTDTLTRLRAIGQVFLNASEVSAQEAVYILMSIPLTLCSRQCIFVNTGEKEKRCKIVKSKAELMKLDPESTDIMSNGLLDYYKNRPERMNDICLADFASNYQMTKANISEFETNPDILDDNESNYINRKRQKIIIRDLTNPSKILCTLVKRIQSKVIRYRRYNKDQDIHNFCREKLMLYMPWRDEDRDISPDYVINLFNQWSDRIIESEKYYIKNCEIDYESIKERLESEEYRESEDFKQETEDEFKIFDLQRPENSLVYEI